MRDIARAVGLQPGALYYYFKNKQEILYFCQDTSLDRLLQAARRVARLRVGPAERLRRIIVEQMKCMLDELQGSAAHIETHALPPRLLEKIIRKRDAYERLVRRIVEEGMPRGAFVKRDPKLVTLAILGAMNWSIKWYRPDGAKAAQEIADVFADFLTRGVKR